MKLKRIKIGNYLELYNKKCGKADLTVDDVSGINKDKEFFEPSKQIGKDTSNYKIVPPNYFACNLMHIGRDVVLPIALNNTEKEKYVSPAYIVFKIIDEREILNKYLFMLLKSNEKDRYFWFHCDSSVRDGMDWDTFCDVEIDVPPIEVQKKYVAVYESLLHNLKVYESKLEDLKLVCDGYIEKLRHNNRLTPIKGFIAQRQEVNGDLEYQLEDVVGVSSEKKIIPTKADASKNDISKFVLVKPNDFIYNPRNGIAVGLNNTKKTKIISWNNTCFYIMDEYKNVIMPEFLFMYLCRSEWDRKTKFLSWGSSTEVFSFDAMGDTVIPLVDLKEQKSIVNIFNSMNKRKQYIENLKKQIQNICPILIKGSIEECR